MTNNKTSLRGCFNYQDGVDTAGNPILKRQCYCETTACLESIFTYSTQPSAVCSKSGEPLVKHLDHYHCTDKWCPEDKCEPALTEVKQTLQAGGK